VPEKTSHNRTNVTTADSCLYFPFIFKPLNHLINSAKSIPSVYLEGFKAKFYTHFPQQFINPLYEWFTKPPQNGIFL